MMKKAVIFLLLFTPLLATELGCNPSSSSTQLDPGSSHTFSFTCTFTSEEYSGTYPLIADRRDEWFYEVEQSDGSFKSITELYPATQYITLIATPEDITESQSFPTQFTLDLPSSYSYTEDQVQARIDLVVTLDNETTTYPIIMTIEQPSQQPPQEENPVDNIIEIVEDLLGGKAGGGGGGGAPGGTDTTQPSQQEQQSTQQPLSQQEQEEPEQESKTPSSGDVKIEVPEFVEQVIGTPDLSLNYTILVIGVIALVIGVILYTKIV